MNKERLGKNSMGKTGKSGRPCGSKSTVGIKLSDLNKYLNPSAVVMVGSTWLVNIGYKVKKSKVVEIESVTPKESVAKVEIQDLDLN